MKLSLQILITKSVFLSIVGNDWLQAKVQEYSARHSEPTKSTESTPTSAVATKPSTSSGAAATTTTNEPAAGITGRRRRRRRGRWGRVKCFKNKRKRKKEKKSRTALHEKI